MPKPGSEPGKAREASSVIGRIIRHHASVNKHVPGYLELLLKLTRNILEVGQQFEIVLANVDDALKDERASSLLTAVMMSAFKAPLVSGDHAVETSMVREFNRLLIALQVRRRSKAKRKFRASRSFKASRALKAGSGLKRPRKIRRALKATGLYSPAAELERIEARYKALFAAVALLEEVFDASQVFDALQEFKGARSPRPLKRRRRKLTIYQPHPIQPEPSSVGTEDNVFPDGDEVRRAVQVWKVALGEADHQSLDSSGRVYLAHIRFVTAEAPKALGRMRLSLEIMKSGAISIVQPMSNSRKAISAPDYHRFVKMLNADLLRASPSLPEVHRLSFLAVMATVLFGKKDEIYSSFQIGRLLREEASRGQPI